MPSELDTRLDAIMDQLTGAGGPLALTTIEQDGVTLPMIAAAPPTLPQYFAYFCAQHGAAEFLVCGEERLTFAEVYAQAQAVAMALVAGFGLQKGDHVGIAARNAPSWIVLYMGILMAGGVASLLNGWWTGPELADAIDMTDTKLVFADPPRAQRLAEMKHGADVVVLDVGLSLEQALAPILGRGGEAPLPELTGDDIATILFTSGSTGRSKGAISTHRAVVQGTFNYIAQSLMSLQLLTQMGETSTLQPATLLNVPLFHVTAEVPVMLQSFAIGRKLVIMGKWDAEEAMRLMENEKITYFVGVPLMSFEILTHPNRHKYDLSTVKDFAAGGAPRPVEHVKRIEDEMGGAKPLIGYGLTETNGVGCGNFRENYLAKPNSTGRASRPLVDLAILDDAGQPVPQGQRGEVCMRSVCNFLHYYKNPDATREAFTADRYFRSGDIGYLDEDGYLFIVDRKKDIIIRGGENISCQEVEAALYENQDVAEAAVFGLADPKFGEVPGAVVHAADGATLTLEGLHAFLATRLAAFKIPERIWIAPDPLPRLGTEKIDKVTIRNHYRALAQQSAAA
ncbi:putative fatty acid--CoA ligase [Sphingomonas changbaiensis NBRC 104936]|uniref:Putative fatty acid--CoA ligase n=1 Tax=Sphingomonas changbaiensis NBRC 104936 TaxID=1219043 RepID=A0A0E9MKU8_9SPHN|nr:class I adenylate-forming enzyme family protein [Sphingomonas changbaiensis]GAO38164.1 putative fatty acid--CoA ligase [Sphingomonas changbaiensis NBRC 104936]